MENKKTHDEVPKIEDTFPYCMILAEMPTGEQNALPAGELARRLNADKLGLRLFIERLRDNGYCICASECGYFFPATKEEAQRWKNHELAVIKQYEKHVKSADKFLAS